LLRDTPSEVRAIESSGMDDDSRIRYLVQVAAALAILVALLVIL
jgi:hypothetical protein